MPSFVLQLTEIWSPSLAFGWPGGGEWLVLLVLGLLIFGRRLPEVGRSLGQGIVEFKKGIRGIQDDIDEESGSKRRIDGDRRQELPRSSRSEEVPATAGYSAAEDAPRQD